jgi:membrane-associated phospholipid phosphatase
MWAKNRGEAVVFVGGFLLPLAAFAAIAAVVAGRSPPAWDADVIRLADRHYDRPIVDALDFGLRLSIGVGAAICGGAVILLLRRSKNRDALLWALVVAGVVALDLALKGLFRRPSYGTHGGGYSFPSGNAMASAAIAAALVFTASARWRRRALVGGVAAVVAYGVTLVYSLWHYPSDIVAGWSLAVAWVTAVWLALRRTPPRERRR